MNAFFGTVLLWAVLVLTQLETDAAAPRSRELIGKVEAIDLSAEKLTVNSHTFALKKQTRFIEHNRFTQPTELREGETVKVNYRSPLFGEKFLTKVRWPAGARQ